MWLSEYFIFFSFSLYGLKLESWVKSINLFEVVEIKLFYIVNFNVNFICKMVSNSFKVWFDSNELVINFVFWFNDNLVFVRFLIIYLY